MPERKRIRSTNSFKKGGYRVLKTGLFESQSLKYLMFFFSKFRHDLYLCLRIWGWISNYNYIQWWENTFKQNKKKCKRKAVVNTNTDIINTDKLYWRVRYRNFMCDEAGEKEG